MQIEIEQIIKSNRKTISIEVLPDKKLRIKAPVKLSRKEIDRIISKHHRWIEKRFENFDKLNLKPKQFVEGEKFLLLGEEYLLKFDNSYTKPQIADNFIIVSAQIEPQWKDIFEKWYRKLAIDKFNERALIYSKLLGVKYRKIKLSSAQRRWGSCSSKGYINLSWRLIMAPLPVIDYVVVHELSHLLQPNHSKKFWALVEKIIPNYKIRQQWLKEYGATLNL